MRVQMQWGGDRRAGQNARRWPLLALAAGALLSLAGAAAAQPDTDFAGHPLQVFLQRNINRAGADRLLFVDTLTGESTPVEVNGRGYTLADRAVLFYDTAAGRVMLARPDGSVTEHPFVQPGPQTRRVDWLLSPDMTHIAWTLTEGPDDSALTTITTVARLDGSDLREGLVDGPRPGIRALPVAFNDDHSVLYMDYQPDSIADITPFQQFAGLFALNLDSGEAAFLPGEPGCFCGAGIGSGLLLRLQLADDLGGFDVGVHHLDSGASDVIPALRLPGYTQGGDVLIAPDGTRAVYALAQVRDFGGPNQSVRTVFVLVNLTARTQTALTSPITTFVQPVAWTEDNTAVIFTSPNQDGTWKVNVNDGRLARIAAATYLGTLG